MTKLSPLMKIVGLAGVALVVIAVALKILVLHPKGDSAANVVVHPVRHRALAPSHTRAAHRSAHTPRVDQSLPQVLRTALARRAVVVAVLAAPDAIDDRDAVDAAREGARAAHAGFAVLNVRKEAVAKALATKVPGTSDPSVLVVTRPGKIAVQLSGYADAESVAQAAVDARP
jgi:hypothetical protein